MYQDISGQWYYRRKDIYYKCIKTLMIPGTIDERIYFINV